MKSATHKPTLDLDWVRSQFPALTDDYVLMDNAGGSQACHQVINRITDYFHHYNVQLGASYKHSSEAGSALENVHETLKTWIGAKDSKEIICGPSTTALLRILSICISENWKEGDEVIVTNTDHEANVSCWMDLRENGIVVKVWEINQDTMQLEISDLLELITGRTRLVAMVHASNLIGTINDVAAISKVVHKGGALLCVDGVAYAPHRPVNVMEWDVDFYVFSTYKTYGPHQAIMYGKLKHLESIPGLNHFFINSVPYKFQPGNFNFELTYSMQGIYEYMSLLGSSGNSTNSQASVDCAYTSIADHEEALSNKLLSYLNGLSQIKIIGHTSGDQHLRVPTISFIHQEKTSSEIVTKTDSFNIGIRYGDFYAVRLINALKLKPKNGVVRVSMVHYNTEEEIDRLIKAFDTIL